MLDVTPENLARLLPSTLRSALRLRPGRSGIFSLDSRRLLLCGIGSRSAALRRLLLLFLLPLPGEFLFCPMQAAGGGVLNGVAAIFIPPPLLGRIPELSPQALRAVIQPLAQKLLWSGYSFLFDTLTQRRFFFNFLHGLSRSQIRGLCGHQAVELVLGEMIHKRHDSASALNEAPAGVHVGDVGKLVI